MKREVMFNMLINAGSIQYMQNMIDKADEKELEEFKKSVLHAWHDC